MSDAKSLAAATIAACQQIKVRLAPVIGARGVEVLFGHALHRMSIDFPWLGTVQTSDDAGSVLEHLESCLAAQAEDEAASAADALLATFTKLLATLIGQSLSDRLLGVLSATPSVKSKHESEL